MTTKNAVGSSHTEKLDFEMLTTLIIWQIVAVKMSVASGEFE